MTVQANSSAVPAASVVTTITITPIVYGPISVSFNPPPPATIAIGTAVVIAAVVTNDRTGSNGKPLGYTLSVTCQVAGTCGNFLGPAYFPPSTIPAGGTVTLTATSVADPTKSASAVIGIVPPVVSISLATLPPTSIPAGSATSLAAFVTDGTPANAAGQQGMDWSVSCGTTACGSVIPQHTANYTGSQFTQTKVTIYAAPSVVPPGGTVTITATATADPTKKTSATLTVASATLNNSLLNGQYAFLLNGVGLDGTSALAGSITADGSGNITSAEECLPGQSAPLTGIAGSYYIGADGRGVMTLNGLPSYTFAWFNGLQIFSLAVVDSKRVLIEEFDANSQFNIRNNPVVTGPYGFTLRGEMDLQQTSDFSVPPSGPFAFAWVHAGPGFVQSPFAGYYGGVLTSDASGNVTTFSMDRYVDGSTGVISSGTYGPQSFGTIDTFGHGTAAIGPYSLNYFLVDSGHVLVIASSSVDGTGWPSGHLYSQPPALPSIAGTYVFTLAGSTPISSANGASIVGSTPQALGGWVTSDASGNVSGSLDTNNNGTVVSAPVTGTLASSAVNGRWVLTLTGGEASKFALYPTSSHGLRMFQLDNQKSGAGSAALQAVPTPALAGIYSASLQQVGSINSARNAALGFPVGLWTDATGQIVANNSTFSGTFDSDQLNGAFTAASGSLAVQTPGQTVAGSFAAGAQGRLTGTITTNSLGNISVLLYVVDANHVMLLESDSIPAVGSLQTQSF